jgi:hypothetical protein
MTVIKHCSLCEQPATWMRYTQFAGNHPFCDKHAELESDFNDGDWEKIELNLTKVQLNWSQDILIRIKSILESKGWTDEQKLVSIAWLVKQGLKKEED